MLEKLVVNVDSITTNVIIVSVHLNGHVYQGALIKGSVHKVAISFYGSILDPVYCDNTFLYKGDKILMDQYGKENNDRPVNKILPLKEDVFDQNFKNNLNPIACATDILRELDDVLDPYLNQIYDNKYKAYLEEFKTLELPEKAFTLDLNKTIEHTHNQSLNDYYSCFSPAALFRCTYYRNPAIITDYYHKSNMSTTCNMGSYKHNSKLLEPSISLESLNSETTQVINNHTTLIDSVTNITKPVKIEENDHALYYGKNFIWPWPVPTKAQILKRSQAKPRRYICVKCRTISMQSPRNVTVLNSQELIQCNQITNNRNDKKESLNNNLVIDFDTFVENQFFKLNDKGKPVAANMSSSAPLFHNPNLIETNLLLPLNKKADYINCGLSDTFCTPTDSAPCKIEKFISNNSINKPITRSHISVSSPSKSAKRELNRRFHKELPSKLGRHYHSHSKHTKNAILSNILDTSNSNDSSKFDVNNNNSDNIINNNNIKRVPKLKLKLKKESSEMTQTQPEKSVIPIEGSTKCHSPSMINLHKHLMTPSNITLSPSKRPRLKMVFRRKKHSSQPTMNANDNSPYSQISEITISSPAQRKLGRPRKRKRHRQIVGSNNNNNNKTVINPDTKIKQEFDQPTPDYGSGNEHSLKIEIPLKLSTDLEIKPEQSITDNESTVASTLASGPPNNASTASNSSQVVLSLVDCPLIGSDINRITIEKPNVQPTDPKQAISIVSHRSDTENNDDSEQEKGVLYIDVPPEEESNLVQTVLLPSAHLDSKIMLSQNQNTLPINLNKGRTNTISPPTKKRGRRKKKKGRPRAKDKLFNGSLPKYKKVTQSTNSDIVATTLLATTKLLNDNASQTTTKPNFSILSNPTTCSQRFASQYVSYSLNCESLVPSASNKSLSPSNKNDENNKCQKIYKRPDIGVIKTNPNVNSSHGQPCVINHTSQTFNQASSMVSTEIVVTCVQSPKVPDHSFILGDVVWGKIQGYPWWPAQIIEFRKKYVEAPVLSSSSTTHQKSSPRRSITTIPSLSNISSPSTFPAKSNSLSILNENWENVSNKSANLNEKECISSKTDKIGITRCLLSWYGEAEPRSISEVGLKDVLPFREFYERYSNYFGPLPPNFVTLPPQVALSPLTPAVNQTSMLGSMTSSLNPQTSVIKPTGFDTPSISQNIGANDLPPQSSVMTPPAGQVTLGCNSNFSGNRKASTQTNRAHTSNFAAAQDPATRAAMQISFRDALVQASQDLRARIRSLPSDKYVA